MLARNRFFPLTNCFVDDVLWYACPLCLWSAILSRWSQRLVSRTNKKKICRCLYIVHTFVHQSRNSVVNRTIWRTQIWRDKLRSDVSAKGAGLFHEHTVTSECVIYVGYQTSSRGPMSPYVVYIDSFVTIIVSLTQGKVGARNRWGGKLNIPVDGLYSW